MVTVVFKYVLLFAGIKDFLPQYDDRSPHTEGYEMFSDVFDRAARYLYADPTKKCINIDSFYAKKKTSKGIGMGIQECTHF